MHRVLRGTSKKRGRNVETRCIELTSSLLKRKDFKFHQTRSNAIILYDTLPAYCIPKAIMMGTGEIIYEKVYASPRTPPKISFEDDWMKELGSEIAGCGKDSQQRQPKTKHPIVGTRRLVLEEQPSSSSSQEIDKRVLLGCAPMKEQGNLFPVVCQCPLNV